MVSNSSGSAEVFYGGHGRVIGVKPLAYQTVASRAMESPLSAKFELLERFEGIVEHQRSLSEGSVLRYPLSSG